MQKNVRKKGTYHQNIPFSAFYVNIIYIVAEFKAVLYLTKSILTKMITIYRNLDIFNLQSDGLDDGFSAQFFFPVLNKFVYNITKYTKTTMYSFIYYNFTILCKYELLCYR